MKITEAIKSGDAVGWLDAALGGKWWRILYGLGMAVFVAGAAFGNSWLLRGVCALLLIGPAPRGIWRR